MNAMVDPLPLVPATWDHGRAKRLFRMVKPVKAAAAIRSSERSISLGCSLQEAAPTIVSNLRHRKPP